MKSKKESPMKKQYLLLAALTHELTGEEEYDIYCYLAKYGVSGFFAKIDAADLNPELKEKLNALQAYVLNYEEVSHNANA